MTSQIVVSVRASHAVLANAADAYLARARALVARGEALGATLAAWAAVTFAFAWDEGSVDEAIAFAVSLKDEPLPPDEAWACGIAEGQMEALAPTGQRAALAWGPALVVATSLARVAAPGEVLVDGDVRAVRVGELATVGAKTSTDGGQRVRGWRLNLSRPWRRPSTARMERIAAPPPPQPSLHDTHPDFATQELAGHDVEATTKIVLPQSLEPERTEGTDEHPIVIVPEIEELPSSALELVDAAVPTDPPPAQAEAPAAWNDVTEVGPAPAALRDPTIPAPPNGATSLAERVRALAHTKAAEGASSFIALRRARARAEGRGAQARCHASLALAVALLLGGRHEEALLEGLDALARAHEEGDPRAISACLALLAKVYAAAGRGDETARLRDAAG